MGFGFGVLRCWDFEFRVARLRVFVCRVVRFKDFETGFFLLGFGVSSFSAKASGWDRR